VEADGLISESATRVQANQNVSKSSRCILKGIVCASDRAANVPTDRVLVACTCTFTRRKKLYFAGLAFEISLVLSGFLGSSGLPRTVIKCLSNGSGFLAKLFLGLQPE